MNRTEVIMTIKMVGNHYSNIMKTLNGREFSEGYKAAINDMITMFNNAPIDPDFESERNAMVAKIRVLKEKNNELEQEVCEKHATIQKLLSHVNIAEVIGVETKKREEPKAQRRGVAFIFK